MQEFTLPLNFVDNYILKAKPEYAMVYLYAYRHKDKTEFCSLSSISTALKIDINTVESAVKYWTDAGFNIFNAKVEPSEKKPEYTSKEINELFKTDKDFEFLRDTVETVLGKALTLGNCRTLAWMYKTAGLDISTIILIANYVKKINKPQVRYMERTAEKILEQGAKTYQDAEKIIAALKSDEAYRNKLKRMFGIDRALTQTEKQIFDLWHHEIKPKDDELMRAYEECVNRTKQYSANYMHGILVNWKDGKTKPKKINDVPTPKATKFNNFEPSGNIDYKKLEMEALRKQLARLKEGEKNG